MTIFKNSKFGTAKFGTAKFGGIISVGFNLGRNTDSNTPIGVRKSLILGKNTDTNTPIGIRNK